MKQFSSGSGRCNMADLQTVVKCFLCNSILDSPIRLLCSHLYCKNCILEYIQTYIDKPSFPCPRCDFSIIPKSPHTKVCTQCVTDLPEDEVSLHFISMIKQGPLETNSSPSVHGMDCVKHKGNKLELYCRNCNLCVCQVCKTEIHETCETASLEGNVDNFLHENKEEYSKVIDNAKKEISNVNQALLPRERQLLIKKEETALGISLYFSELRSKVTKYLLQQEQKIQEDLENLVALEKSHIVEEVKLSSSLLDALEVDQTAVNNLLRSRSESMSKNVANLHLLGLMQMKIKELNDISIKLNQEPPETRFIINTELEDSLTNCDLVKIEVVNTRMYDQTKESNRNVSSSSDPVTDNNQTTSDTDTDSDQSSSETDEEDEKSQESDDNGISSDGETETVDENTPDRTIVTGSEQGSQEAENSRNISNTGVTQRNVVIEVEYPDEPPPPYPGIAQSVSASPSPSIVPNRQNNQTTDRIESSASQNKMQVGPSSFHHLRPVPSAPPAPNDDVLDTLVRESMRPSTGASSSNSLYPTVERSLQPSPQPLRRPRPEPSSRASDHIPSSTKFLLDRIWQANTMAVGEQRTPRIFGMVWIDHSNLLVADRWNNRLKVINRGTIIHVFSLGSFQPWDLAEMPNSMSAVAIPEGKMIYLVAFKSPELQIRRKITTKRGYSSLAYNAENKTFVCTMIPQFHNPPGVDILDFDGRHMTSYFPVNMGRSFLAYPRALEITHKRTVLTDFQKKSMIFLKVVNRRIVSSKYMGTDAYPLREPNGMAINHRDKYIMVIDTRSSKIHVVSESGHFIGMVQTELDHDDPCVAAINHSGSCLAVAFGNGVVVNYRLSAKNPSSF